MSHFIDRQCLSQSMSDKDRGGKTLFWMTAAGVHLPLPIKKQTKKTPKPQTKQKTNKQKKNLEKGHTTF